MNVNEETDQVIDEQSVEPGPQVEINRYSRWSDEQNILHVVIDKWKPQTFDTNREAQLLVLEVHRECSRLIARSEFESAILMGRLVRKLD